MLPVATAMFQIKTIKLQYLDHLMNGAVVLQTQDKQSPVALACIIFNSIKGKSHFHKCVLFPREKGTFSTFSNLPMCCLRLVMKLDKAPPLSP